MAVVIGATTTNTTATTRSNTDPLEPSGIGAGDGALVLLHVEDDVSVTKDGAGWTLLFQVDHASRPMDFYCWYNPNADGADFGTTHASSWSQAAALEVSGHNTDGSIDPATASTNTGTSTTPSASSITTLIANTFLCAGYEAWESGSSFATYSSPITENIDVGQFSVASGEQVSAGASGAKTCTATFGGGGAQEWATGMFGVPIVAAGVTTRRYSMPLTGLG